MKVLAVSPSIANLGEDIPLPAQANLSQFSKRQVCTYMYVYAN